MQPSMFVYSFFSLLFWFIIPSHASSSSYADFSSWHNIAFIIFVSRSIIHFRNVLFFFNQKILYYFSYIFELKILTSSLNSQFVVGPPVYKLINNLIFSKYYFIITNMTAYWIVFWSDKTTSSRLSLSINF